MPKNPQNTIIQTELKHYNEFRNVRTGAPRWVKMTTDTGIKFKVEASDKERDQQLLDFITIDILRLEQQKLSGQYIMTLPMNLTINSSFKKHPMSWDIIHCRLIQLSDIVIKSM